MTYSIHFINCNNDIGNNLTEKKQQKKAVA